MTTSDAMTDLGAAFSTVALTRAQAAVILQALAELIADNEIGPIIRDAGIALGTDAPVKTTTSKASTGA